MKPATKRMAHSITNALSRLLAALLLAISTPAHPREVPEWFADAMLDARDEAADAATQGKRLMLYFWLEGCPYCQRMTSVTFRDPAVLERLKRGFVPAAINVRGDRDITWTDGATLTEKQLAAKLQVRVDVPLGDASAVHIGQAAEVVVHVAPERVFAGHHIPVIMPNRQPRPGHSRRLRREVDVYEPRCVRSEYELEHAREMRFQAVEISFGIAAAREAQRDTARAKQYRLARAGERARMPGRITKVQAEIDAG